MNPRHADRLALSLTASTALIAVAAAALMLI